jgi:hypothetical protein
MSKKTNTDKHPPAFESRRNWAVCFRNQKKDAWWKQDATGVMVLDPDGRQFWVNVYLREQKTRKGKSYIVVALRPKENGKGHIVPVNPALTTRPRLRAKKPGVWKPAPTKERDWNRPPILRDVAVSVEGEPLDIPF